MLRIHQSAADELPLLLTELRILEWPDRVLDGLAGGHEQRDDSGDRRHRKDRPPHGAAADGPGVPARVASRSGNVRFDWAYRTTWTAALRGVNGMFRSPPNSAARSSSTAWTGRVRSAPAAPRSRPSDRATNWATLLLVMSGPCGPDCAMTERSTPRRAACPKHMTQLTFSGCVPERSGRPARRVRIWAGTVGPPGDNRLSGQSVPQVSTLAARIALAMTRTSASSWMNTTVARPRTPRAASGIRTVMMARDRNWLAAGVPYS